eukprot:2504567-Rhodomonas_salina.2
MLDTSTLVAHDVRCFNTRSHNARNNDNAGSDGATMLVTTTPQCLSLRHLNSRTLRVRGVSFDPDPD